VYHATNTPEQEVHERHKQRLSGIDVVV